MSIEVQEIPPRQVRKGTAEKLVRAAQAEFNERGFDGTDTNRIARRAGFAPQTFYRWFKDKADIFIAVYALWQQEEAEALRNLLEANAPDARLVQACVAHHRGHRVFRRSLRGLSLENEAVRAARAQSRRNQIVFIRGWGGAGDRDSAEIATALLEMERLSDALAEGEFRDMGLSDSAAEAELARIIRSLRGG